MPHGPGVSACRVSITLAFFKAASGMPAGRRHETSGLRLTGKPSQAQISTVRIYDRIDARQNLSIGEVHLDTVLVGPHKAFAKSVRRDLRPTSGARAALSRRRLGNTAAMSARGYWTDCAAATKHRPAHQTRCRNRLHRRNSRIQPGLRCAVRASKRTTRRALRGLLQPRPRQFRSMSDHNLRALSQVRN